MKKFSVLLVIFLLLGCKKKGDTTIVNDTSMHSCMIIESVKPYLIGKWKLFKWRANHYNTMNCSGVGVNDYLASDYDVDATLEVTSNGIFRTFLMDSLVNESFATKEFVGVPAIAYRLNCQQMNIEFRKLNDFDTLSNIEIGDTLKINNPYLEINFANGSTWSITKYQYYVKIE